MSFKVVWSPIIEQLLTTLWLGARDRAAITDAVDGLDAALRRDPLAVGESREQDERVAFYGPLGFLYQVDGGRRIVYVKDLWRTH